MHSIRFFVGVHAHVEWRESLVVIAQQQSIGETDSSNSMQQLGLNADTLAENA